MTPRIFGIRHHGPGSARSLVRELAALDPDCVLIEGPVDAERVLPLARDPGLEPPIAILARAVERRGVATFYPLAIFSPEWQAIRFAAGRDVPVRFIDLPAAVTLAMSPAGDAETEPAATEQTEVRTDPIAWLAAAAGEGDAERWWEQMVEERGQDTDVFDAIAEAMTAVREVFTDDPLREQRREAHMRLAIRKAERDGYARIAVVCGAYHVPALAQTRPASADSALLKDLPRVKVEAVWIPWTHDRIAAESGYGAGVRSPGWYDHLWRQPDAPQIPWMARVAALMRSEDLDASPAEVVDAVRLADSLCAMRERHVPGLQEMNEATLAVLCHGDAAPLALIRNRLVIGVEIGSIPTSAPVVPLQADIEATARRLRIKRETTERRLDLDLRKPAQLDLSRRLHRLRILDVPWAAPEASSGKGTFHEVWKLRWRPELALAIIEASVWGNTVAEAAAARAAARAAETTTVAATAQLLDLVILAELPEAATIVLQQLDERSALTTDTTQLMEAVPALTRVARYGSVRKTDAEMVAAVLDRFVTRISDALGVACAGVDDEEAARMVVRIEGVASAVASLSPDLNDVWSAALAGLMYQDSTHPRLRGRACRLLLEAERVDHDTAAVQLERASSAGATAASTAAWLEGFLTGGGLILLVEDRLFQLLDHWLTGLKDDAFVEVLALLRRTLSLFPAGERRQIGERVVGGAQRDREEAEAIDEERARRVLPVLEQLLGIAAP